MRNEDKTREQLIEEMAELRQQVAELKASEVRHKQVEDALRESEAIFRNLLEYIPGISVQGYRVDGTVRYWN
ncbi:MAG: hypothetical protein PVH39_04240, partial [Syntrophobacterales bacterium]